MNTKTKVIKLLEEYPDTMRKIAALRYEREHPATVSPDEMIEALSFARGDSEVHSSGSISNKTLYIAMNYQTEAARLSSGAMAEITGRLVPLEREMDRLEHYVTLLSARHATVIRLYYFKGQPWEAIGKAISSTPRTAQKLRNEAVEQLIELYTYTDSAQ